MSNGGNAVRWLHLPDMAMVKKVLPIFAIIWGLVVLVLYEVRWPFTLGGIYHLYELFLTPPWPSISQIFSRQLNLVGGILVFAAIQISMVAAGMLVLPWIGVYRNGFPFLKIVIMYLVGLGVTGSAIFGMALPGLLFREVLFVVIICGLVYFWQKGRARLGFAVMELRETVKRNRLAQWLALGCAGLLIFSLPAALAPEADFLNDSLIYHLPIAARAERLHKLVPMQQNFQFSYPAIIEMVRTMGFVLQGETAGTLLNWFVTALTAVTLALLATGQWSKACSWYGAALYLSNGIVLSYTTLSKSDSVLALFGLGAVFCLLRCRSSGRLSWAALTGLLIGFQCGIKYVAGIVFGLPVLVGLLACTPSTKRWNALAVASLGLAIPLAPWLLRNFLEVGNPLFPFLGRLFGGLSLSPASEQNLIEFAREVGQHEHYRTWLEKLVAPWTMCFSDGFNPTWLVVMPLVFLCVRLRGETGVWLAVAVGGFVAWTLSMPKYHYLFPIMAVGVVPVARGLWCAAQAGFKFPVVLLGGLLLLSQLGHRFTTSLHLQSFLAGIGLEEPQAYFERRFSTYAVASKTMQAFTSRQSCVLFVGELKCYPLIRYRKVLLPSVVEPFQVYPLIRSSRTPDELWRRLRQLRVTHILHNQTSGFFIRQATSHFQWTERDVHVWAECWRRHARLLYTSSKIDIKYGWFTLYALTDRVDVPATLTLPGIDGMLSVLEQLFRDQRWREYARALNAVRWEMQDFATFQFFLGTLSFAQGNKLEALMWLEKAEKQGLVALGLFENLAALALERNDSATAHRYFLKIAEKYRPVPEDIQKVLEKN